MLALILMLTISKIFRRAPRPFIFLQRVRAYIKLHKGREHACDIQHNLPRLSQNGPPPASGHNNPKPALPLLI